MVDIISVRPNVSINTLNVTELNVTELNITELNVPLKRQRMSDWIKNQG